MGQLQSGLDAVINTIENNSVQISWEKRQEFWDIWKELTGIYWEELPELQSV